MKNTILKVMGKVSMEIAKLAIFWKAIIPWMSDLMEYDWDWSETLVEIVGITAVSFAGYFCITKVKAYIAELKAEKEEKKNSKKRGNAKKASPDSFFRVEFMDIYGKILYQKGFQP